MDWQRWTKDLDATLRSANTTASGFTLGRPIAKPENTHECETSMKKVEKAVGAEEKENFKKSENSIIHSVCFDATGFARSLIAHHFSPD